jgi:hypothetical protein
VRRYGRDAGDALGAFAGGEARGQIIGWTADAIHPPGSAREDIGEAAPCRERSFGRKRRHAEIPRMSREPRSKLPHGCGRPGPPPTGAGSPIARAPQQEQQIGMLFIIRQQQHPAFIIDVIEVQQASIIAVQAASPLVHVMRTPPSIASLLQWAIMML